MSSSEPRPPWSDATEAADVVEAAEAAEVAVAEAAVVEFDAGSLLLASLSVIKVWSMAKSSEDLLCGFSVLINFFLFFLS